VLLTWFWASWSPLMAVTATGTSISRSSRFCATTITSSRSAERPEPLCACAAPAHTTTLVAASRLSRKVARFITPSSRIGFFCCDSDALARRRLFFEGQLEAQSVASAAATSFDER
jgi:hypothetical protein